MENNSNNSNQLKDYSQITNSLTVVGSGIKCISHLTTETITYVEQTECVLYLVNDPVMKEWIQKHAPYSESLDELYHRYPLRSQNYQAITDYIVEQSRQKHVCVVLYGHPTVFAQPALDAAEKLKSEGVDVEILPNISAEDCLYADLMVDPGTYGVQSYEVTDFLIRERVWDPSSALILWQVGVIGGLGSPDEHDNSIGTRVLGEYLLKQYKPSQPAVIYVASQYPGMQPTIIHKTVKDLVDIEYPRLATLYIPAAFKKEVSENVLKKLGIDKRNLTYRPGPKG